MPLGERLWYVLVLVAVASAFLGLVLSAAEGFGITSVGHVERMLSHPAYWVFTLVLGWVLAPSLSKRLPVKRW